MNSYPFVYLIWDFIFQKNPLIEWTKTLGVDSYNIKILSTIYINWASALAMRCWEIISDKVLCENRVLCATCAIHTILNAFLLTFLPNISWVPIYVDRIFGFFPLEV